MSLQNDENALVTAQSKLELSVPNFSHMEKGQSI